MKYITIIISMRGIVHPQLNVNRRNIFQSRLKISDWIREFDATIQKIKKIANCLINGLQYKKINKRIYNTGKDYNVSQNNARFLCINLT